MTVTVTGEGPTIPHVRTGLFSLDVAWGKRRTHELGMPLRSIHHIYGHPETGKNTLAFYLAGCIQPAGKVVYIALESSDRDYVADASAQSGFHGEVQYAKMMDGEKHRAHADVLDDVRKQVLLEPGITAVILDSLGRLRSRSEEAAKMGEASMGKRALLANQYWRDMEGAIFERPTASAMFVLNHVYRGGMGEMLKPGVIRWQTPGGNGIHFIAASESFLWHKETLEAGNTIAYLSTGRVEKLRYGGKGPGFRIGMIGGLGISPEMTAVWDAEGYGLLKRDAAVKVDGLSIGRIGTLVRAAAERQREKFEPVFAALAKYEEGMKSEWQSTEPPKEKPSRRKK